LWAEVRELLEEMGDGRAVAELDRKDGACFTFELTQRLKLETSVDSVNDLAGKSRRRARKYKKLEEAKAGAAVQARAALGSPALSERLEMLVRPSEVFNQTVVWRADRWDAVCLSCQRCKGHGRLVCSGCGGNPVKKCLGCSGSGSVSCGTCAGTGSTGFNAHGVMQICYLCSGSGRQSCVPCGGSGNQWVCSACGGRGSFQCEACGGRKSSWVGLLGEIRATSESEIRPVGEEPVPKDKVFGSAPWLGKNASRTSLLKQNLGKEDFVSVWRLEVPVVSVRYRLGDVNHSSRAIGTAFTHRSHAPFLDGVCEASVAAAEEKAGEASGDINSLTESCAELAKTGLGRSCLGLASRGERSAERLSAKLSGSAGNQLLERAMATACKVVDGVVSRKGGRTIRWAAVSLAVLQAGMTLWPGWDRIAGWMSQMGVPSFWPWFAALVVSLGSTLLVGAVGYLRTTLALRRVAGMHLKSMRAHAKTRAALWSLALAAPLSEILRWFLGTAGNGG